MEELAIKLAETLDISVKAAIDMYPVIRGQYIWYSVLTSIGSWSIILWFGSIIIGGIAWVIRSDTEKYDWKTDEITEDWANINKLFKLALSFFVALLVIAITTELVVPFLAPDIVLIKNLLG